VNREVTGIGQRMGNQKGQQVTVTVEMGRDLTEVSGLRDGTRHSDENIMF
jgi:hypothetical protein